MIRLTDLRLWHHLSMSGDPDPLEPWRRLGAAVIARRVELGYRTREAFAEKAGLTSKTLAEVERGLRASYDPATLAKVERTLRWQPGRVRQILDGPQVIDPAEVARTIARDDFVPTWLIVNSGLSPADVLRVELLVRQRREEWERAVLWPEVAALITGLGGTVSYPWDVDPGLGHGHPGK
jgi:transcriptional regulator with XRE-family HTH domain